MTFDKRVHLRLHHPVTISSTSGSSERHFNKGGYFINCMPQAGKALACLESRAVTRRSCSGLSQLETRRASTKADGSSSPQLPSGGRGECSFLRDGRGRFHGGAKWEDGSGTDLLASCLGECHDVSSSSSSSSEDLLALVDHRPWEADVAAAS